MKKSNLLSPGSSEENSWKADGSFWKAIHSVFRLCGQETEPGLGADTFCQEGMCWARKSLGGGWKGFLRTFSLTFQTKGKIGDLARNFPLSHLQYPTLRRRMRGKSSRSEAPSSGGMLNNKKEKFLSLCQCEEHQDEFCLTPVEDLYGWNWPVGGTCFLGFHSMGVSSGPHRTSDSGCPHHRWSFFLRILVIRKIP